MTTIRIGKFSSTMASGPCFNSPRNEGEVALVFRNIEDVLLKTSAIHKLNYRWRDLLKILLSDTNFVEYDKSLEDDLLKKVCIS